MYDDVKAPMRKVKRRCQLNVNQEGKSGAVWVRREKIKLNKMLLLILLRCVISRMGMLKGRQQCGRRQKGVRLWSVRERGMGKGSMGCCNWIRGRKKKNYSQRHVRVCSVEKKGREKGFGELTWFR